MEGDYCFSKFVRSRKLSPSYLYIALFCWSRGGLASCTLVFWSCLMRLYASFAGNNKLGEEDASYNRHISG